MEPWFPSRLPPLFFYITFLSSTLSAPNTTNDVLPNSPKGYPYIPFKQFGRILLFILDSLQCFINSYNLTTKQLILYRYCKEKIDVDKPARAERVKIDNDNNPNPRKG